MSDSFVHLHSHSSYSLLDGLARIDDLLQACRKADMPALALTDHGTMFGAIEFYEKANELGVKPIIGCEVYVSDAPLTARPGPASKTYHLVLLAENEAGYRNLIQLTTHGHLQGFYRKPRVDHALLERYSEGLICLSGCASSEVARLIQDGNLVGAEERADWYRQVYPGRYYLELQYHELELQKTINQGILHLRQRLDLPLVASNDVHYVWQRQARAHEVLLCVQTQTTMSDPKRMRMQTQEFYLKSPEQMRTLFGDYPGAVSNTLAIAERCTLELGFGSPQLPRFDSPPGMSSEQFLRTLCEVGLKQRYGEETAETRARLEYEIGVIIQTGFVDYFLLVYDVIRFARAEGIAVGPGRGSAAASIVAYVLYITNIDPIAHGLSFERFLNPERVSMPDMDLDFADDRRDELIRYVTEKYGRERVAQIITFGTIGPRAGVRDVGRVLGVSYPDVDRVAKLVPFMCSKVSKAKEEAPELQAFYDSDPAMRTLLDTVEDLEGVARHASTHAAGVVISRDPLVEHVPLYKIPRNDQITTQYAMSSVEKLGLLKLDFLGLRTLTILERARSFIERTTGQPMSLDDIPLEHPSIYELLSSGETFGVFQVDGTGFRKLMRELKPSEFKHIVAAGALYRPGPMDHIPEFVARKNGQRAVTYAHPALKEALEETYGIVVYQDQVMKVAALVAGYSMAEADLLRRAMGKKKPAELAKHRDDFISRAAERGTDPKTAEQLFNVIEPFAGYAFNKAHAAAYAVITCQTAYLKANHPIEFMAGLLSAEKENAERVSEAMAESSRLAIEILAPDINASDLDFTLENGAIRFGLGAIKHVGSAAIDSLLQARRDGGPFASLEDMCSRIDCTAINKRVLESLARSGALDCLGVERKRIVEGLERIVAFATQLQRMAASGQVSLFGDVSAAAPSLQLPLAEPATPSEKVAWEEELLGIAVSPHPLSEMAPILQAAHAVTVADVTAAHDGQRVRAAGAIKRLRTFSTKDGRPMASLQLADLRASVEVVIFSRSYEALRDTLAEGLLVMVDAKVDASDGRLRLLASDVRPVHEMAENPPVPLPAARQSQRALSPAQSGTSREDVPAVGRTGRRVTIELVRGADRARDLETAVAAYQLLQRYPGDDEVEMLVKQGKRLCSVPLPHRHVGYCEELEKELRNLVGPGDVHVQDARVSA